MNMSKLHMKIRTKRESYGMTRHDSYSVVIPYTISQTLSICDGMTLYASISTNTNTIRLHKKEHSDMRKVLVRQELTKTYKNQKYHSARITIPIEFIKELKLKKGDTLNIDYTNTTITIKKPKANLS